jgi:hypothetical protein
VASRIELTNLTRGYLFLSGFYRIPPVGTLQISMNEVRQNNELAFLIYRLAKERKLFGKFDGALADPVELMLEFTDPMATSRGTEFPGDAPVGKFFFRTDLGPSGEMYLRDNTGWLNLTPTPAAHGSTHLPVGFGGSDPIPGIERLQDMYNCTLAETPLDLVYQSAGDTVNRADASNPATMPAVGFVESKSTPTTCLIVTSGLLSGFLAKYAGIGGLVPDAPYFADPANPGLITTTAPSGVGEVLQLVGYAKNSNELLIGIEPHILL